VAAASLPDGVASLAVTINGVVNPAVYAARNPLVARALHVGRRRRRYGGGYVADETTTTAAAANPTRAIAATTDLGGGPAANGWPQQAADSDNRAAGGTGAATDAKVTHVVHIQSNPWPDVRGGAGAGPRPRPEDNCHWLMYSQRLR